jgi:hypothetical protein
MGRTMTKNPSWIQFDNDMWGEAVGGSSDHGDWLRSLDSPELPASTLDPLPDVNASLRQGWIAEQAKESVEEERSRFVGPHGPTWAYRLGIEAEISRLSLACRESTGIERESNLRQLREAEAALREFDSTPEFHEAIRHALNVVGCAIESAGSDLSPAQTIAKARYAAIRASLEAMLPDAAPPASTPRNEAQRKPEIGASKGEILAVFPPLKGQTAEQWEKMLGDPPDWLKLARIDRGGRGVQSRWNPALLAMSIEKRGDMQRGQLGAIIRRSFPEYLDQWEDFGALAARGRGR